MTTELAQVNISRLLAPLDSPQLAEFVEALDPVNAAADTAPGFRWRLKSEDGNATSMRVFDDDWLIVNMSVWESQERLVHLRTYGPSSHVFTLKSGHGATSAVTGAGA